MRNPFIHVLLTIALAGGCRGYYKERNPDRDSDTTSKIDSASDTGPTVDTDTDTTTSDTGPFATPYECSLPPVPTSWDYLPWVPASEEFQFDALGNLVNIDEVAGWIFQTPFGGPANLIAPYNATEIAAIRFMLDGDLAVADEESGALRRVGLDGSQTTILGGLNNPNSVTVHSDGHVFTTAFDEVYRVDAATGVNTRMFRLPGADLDGLVFSPDFTRLYFNSDETGLVGAIDIDANGVPGNPFTLTYLSLGWDDQLDGQAVDSCGNIYVIRTDGRLFRLRPDQTVESLIQLSIQGGLKTTSLHFGSGVGGWELDHLYVMNREGGMFDLDIGIDGSPPAHLLP
mgnify:CR=1 FL=1